ncbi:MAG TPA: toprim domain-containing protein [Bryobacteraceae bacterium]|nr:toprim domain-containing protein [Bryobacteraceae bacterium]
MPASYSAESAIDALSHAALFPDDRARYSSIGGKPSPAQPELIRATIARLPADADVISAMDTDADGSKLADVVRKAVDLSGRHDLRFVVHEPSGFKDWNDQLREKQPEFSFPAVRPSLKAG